jgi:hypothetical protein
MRQVRAMAAPSKAQSLKNRLVKQALNAGVNIAMNPDGTVAFLKCQGMEAMSWNKFWEGMHYQARSSAARIYRGPIESALDAKAGIRVWDKPVVISVWAYGAGRLVDPDNVCLKPIIDALKGKVIQDDTPACVSEVRVRVLRSDEPYPYLTISLQEAA